MAATTKKKSGAEPISVLAAGAAEVYVAALGDRLEVPAVASTGHAPSHRLLHRLGLGWAQRLTQHRLDPGAQHGALAGEDVAPVVHLVDQVGVVGCPRLDGVGGG